MLANMSHEIRTPLTSVIGFAEAIGEETDEEAPASRFAGLIRKSGKRLLRTLDGVLNLSKLEAGQTELTPGPVDLGAQAREAAREAAAKAKGNEVDIRLEANRTPARADEGTVQIVVQNLLSNAIKYTEEGTVWIRTRQEDAAAALEVEDTGIGMEPEIVEELFEPFRQESEGLSRQYEGTGLGLTIAKRAVEQMRGTIGVETEKGKGSRFIVRLPRAEVQ
jgi:signal transduction histidine kinase